MIRRDGSIAGLMACVGEWGWDPEPTGKAVLGQDHRQFTHSNRREGRDREAGRWVDVVWELVEVTCLF